MLRTMQAFFNPDVMPSTAAHRSPLSTPLAWGGVRLQWTARDGRLMSRWHRVAHDLANEGARITDCPAA
jgi:hypothetical protein